MSRVLLCVFFFFKQKTAYEMRSSDWSSDVCSSDLSSTGMGRDWRVCGGSRRGLFPPHPDRPPSHPPCRDSASGIVGPEASGKMRRIEVQKRPGRQPPPRQIRSARRHRAVGDAQQRLVDMLVACDDIAAAENIRRAVHVAGETAPLADRSEESRVGKECCSTCECRWCP